MLKKIQLTVLGLFFSLMGLSAHAAIDVADVVSGIGEAQTAILAVIGALLALSVAIFGLSKVYSFVKRRAGA